MLTELLKKKILINGNINPDTSALIEPFDISSSS